MFAKFNLKITDDDVLQYNDSKESFFQKYYQNIDEKLDQFFRGTNIIDGKKLQENWFSTDEQFDVFLSHSHKDENLAISLANFLYQKLNLRAFVDSCLWGYSDKLLKEIDNTYCKIPNQSSYFYDKRNYSTSHVHMMLSIALMNMIDKCEAVFFINTPNSVSVKNYIEEKSSTTSPWIYHELVSTYVLRRRSPERPLKKTASNYKPIQERLKLQIEYNINRELKECCDLTMEDLNKCVSDTTEMHALDKLYMMKGL